MFFFSDTLSYLSSDWLYYYIPESYPLAFSPRDVFLRRYARRLGITQSVIRRSPRISHILSARYPLGFISGRRDSTRVIPDIYYGGGIWIPALNIPLLYLCGYTVNSSINRPILIRDVRVSNMFVRGTVDYDL